HHAGAAARQLDGRWQTHPPDPLDERGGVLVSLFGGTFGRGWFRGHGVELVSGMDGHIQLSARAHVGRTLEELAGGQLTRPRRDAFGKPFFVECLEGLAGPALIDPLRRRAGCRRRLGWARGWTRRGGAFRG